VYRLRTHLVLQNNTVNELFSELKLCKTEDIKNYNFACCSVWV